MSKSRLEWKVGLFVVVGLVLLAVLCIEFSKGLNFHKTYNIYLRANNVNGLKSRASVSMSGVQVGTVGDIQLAQGGRSATITLKILKDYTIHKDAAFTVDQAGFLGDMYVSIRPTENKREPFKNGDMADAEKPFNIQEFLGSSGSLIARLEGMAGSLSNVISEVERLVLTPATLTNLAELVANARMLSGEAVTTVHKVNGIIDTNGPVISQVFSNLLDFSAQLSQVSGAATNLLATNAPALAQAVDNIESSTEILKSMMLDIHAGRGPVGTLVRNEQVSADLMEIVKNLSITTSNLNRGGLWGILWHKKEAHSMAPPPAQRKSPMAPKIKGH
jgi:phospholipid/cholesterol/gamma-HCH transport system substrate-binding protein